MALWHHKWAFFHVLSVFLFIYKKYNFYLLSCDQTSHDYQLQITTKKYIIISLWRTFSRTLPCVEPAYLTPKRGTIHAVNQLGNFFHYINRICPRCHHTSALWLIYIVYKVVGMPNINERKRRVVQNAVPGCRLSVLPDNISVSSQHAEITHVKPDSSTISHPSRCRAWSPDHCTSNNRIYHPHCPVGNHIMYMFMAEESGRIHK